MNIQKRELCVKSILSLHPGFVWGPFLGDSGNFRTDERILGVGDFVERVLREADEKARGQFRGIDRRKKIQRLIQSTCWRKDISIDELRMGSRPGRLPQIRSPLASRLVTELGISLAEVARQLGVSTSSISKTLEQKKKKIMST